MSSELLPCPFCGSEWYKADDDGWLRIDHLKDCYLSNISFRTTWSVKQGMNSWFFEHWNTRAERTCMDTNKAWSDFGANVFDDDALDDFDKFEKVYQVCQEIVEPLEFTCRIERTEQDEFGLYDYLSCGHIAMRQWPEKTRYCPNCGAKVVKE